MKKYLIFTLLFASCTIGGIRNQFVVKEICQSMNSNLCNYSLYCSNGNFGTKLNIVDSCGLYQVGDTLKLVKK